MTFLAHESIHITLSLFVGYLVFRRYRKLAPSLTAAILGGVLIDLDHFLDYFLTFGSNFKLNYFLKGYQFLKSDKIYLSLHSWELVIILLVLSFILSIIHHLSFIIKLTAILLAFSLSLFLHLIVDMKVDYVTFRGYSLIYRATHNYDLKYFVPEKHYQRHLMLKSRVRL